MNKHQINIEEWPRKDHYHFFRQFDNPFFGVTFEVDCTKGYHYCKTNGYSFFLWYLYQSLAAVNQTASLRLRIEGDKVYDYDRIDASPTILRPDGTFGFSYIPFERNFELFSANAKTIIKKVQSEKGLNPAVSGENVIHYSAVPWLKVTALEHASHSAFKDSCPKISFGKMTGPPQHLVMPVSLHAHHALVDGFHAGQFADLFQRLLNGE